MYNCHIHTFKEEDVPRGFLPFRLVSIVSTKIGYKIVKWILKLFSNDKFEKYIRFVDVGKLPAQEQIFDICDQNYPKNTKYILLPIDMEYMGAGKVPRSYPMQFGEVISLGYKYPDKIMIFPHIDPRRFNFMEFVKSSRISGIKLYPPMGYLPDDPKLNVMYGYCNKNHIPILVHCGEDSPTHWRGKKSYIENLLKNKNISYNPRWNLKKLSAQLCHPQLFSKLLTKYPNINFCLAHWASHSSWKEYIENPSNSQNWFVIIKRMLKIFPNLYTDISFTLYDPEYYSILKVMLSDPELKEKILFGSDFYMVKSVARERKFSFDLRGYLGEELWDQITNINPKLYLGL